MIVDNLLSDQLLMWSARNDREILFRFKETPQSPAAQTAATGLHSPGIAHRALQTLWEAWLQVRRWSWARPQVLPFCEFPGQIATNGLRSPERGHRGERARCQLSSNPRDSRRDIRDQSRIAAPARGVLRSCGERCSEIIHRLHRFPVWRRADRQHDRDLARSRTWYAACDPGGCR